MFLLRSVDTCAHRHLLAQFDLITREALGRILGAPVSDLQWRQSKLPISLGGMGLRASMDHCAAAYATSYLQSQSLVDQLLGTRDEEAELLLSTVLPTLSIQLGEETTVESLTGLTQKMVSTKIDLTNQSLLSPKIQEAGEREVAQWLPSLSLKLVHGSTAPLSQPLVFTYEDLSLWWPPSSGWGCPCTIARASAPPVERTATFWVTTAWSVAMVGREIRGIMPSEMPSTILPLQLALHLRRKAVLCCLVTTEGQQMCSSQGGLEGGTLPLMSL